VTATDPTRGADVVCVQLYDEACEQVRSFLASNNSANLERALQADGLTPGQAKGLLAGGIFSQVSE
jgi:hypothetical protein